MKKAFEKNKDEIVRVICLVLCGLMIIPILLSALTGCSAKDEPEDIGPELVKIINDSLKEYEEQQSQSSKALENEDSIEELKKHKEQVLETLKEQGLVDDDATIDDVQTTDNGLSILGDSVQPIKSFNSLHEAETTFGYYLGLRNIVNDGTKDWELVSMSIIGSSIMYGRYETQIDDKQQLFTIKTSKEDSSELLTSTYDKPENIEKEILNTIECHFGSTDGKWQICWFDTVNGKSYAVYSSTGFSSLAELKAIINELTYNITTMEDWENSEDDSIIDRE